jgi:hypothetical protein
LSSGEKRAFERLWAKVQLEGEKALSAGERQELRALMGHIEELAKTPLRSMEKDPIREQARRLYKQLNPHLAQAMTTNAEKWPVHHRRPLQYAHLFPDENINAPGNLAVVEVSTHRRINALWERFRKSRPQPTADEVLKATEAIDSQFKAWYHRVDDVVSSSRTPEDAEKAALELLRGIFSGLE